MIDRYIVSFEAGTSGRFVCSIVWNLINNFDFEYEFTDTNSAHLRGPWIESIEYIDSENKLNNIKSNPSLVNHPNVYGNIHFTDNNISSHNQYSSGLLQTHTYPNFDIISQRIPNAKIIIIAFEENDIIEIILNTLYKNFFDLSIVSGWLEPFKKSNHLLYDKLINMCDIYHTTNSLPNIDYMRNICIEYCKYFITNPVFNKKSPFYIDNNINIDTNNTLILPYKELFTKSKTGYIGLDKISNFTKKQISYNTFLSYKKYVDGRNYFLKNAMPDINDISYHVKLNNKNVSDVWPNIHSYKNKFTLSLYDIEYKSPNLPSNMHPKIDVNFFNSTFILGPLQSTKHIYKDIWPPIHVNFQSPTYSLGYIAENDKNMFKYINVSIWPSTFDYSLYFSGYTVDDYHYNYEFHTYVNVWPNILTHNINPKYILGYHCSNEFHTYSNFWPNILNPKYILGVDSKDFNYNHLYHNHYNIWPDIMQHNPNNSYCLGKIDNSVHNVSYKGNEYIVATNNYGFGNLLVSTLWSIENKLLLDFDMLGQVKPWAYSINIFDLKSYDNPYVYEKFEFVYRNYKQLNYNYVGLLQTTKYPDFEIIFKRYPNAKIIIISLDEDDKKDIVVNIVNEWLSLPLDDIPPFNKMQVKNAYMDFYGTELVSTKNLDKEFIDFLLEKIYNSLEKRNYFNSFVNATVPAEHKDKVLIIRHKDFYIESENSYKALERLTEFINIPVENEVIHKYKYAIQNRNTIINKYL